MHAVYQAQFTVDPDATPGPRALRVQFGTELMTAKAVVTVTKPSPERKWLIWAIAVAFIVVLGAVLWARRRR